MPKSIKKNIEKGKLVLNDLKNKGQIQLNCLLNDCINIENNINDISIISEKILQFKNMNLNIKFIPDDKEINSNTAIIKNLLKIQYQYFKFKTNLNNIRINNNYTVKGEYQNIVENNSNKKWVFIQCDNILGNNKIYKWKIKILTTKYYNIMAGVSYIFEENDIEMMDIQERFKPIIRGPLNIRQIMSKDVNEKIILSKKKLNITTIMTMIDELNNIKFNAPKIGGGIDIRGPKIGLPNVDIDINAPKIGGGIDIRGPKIGLPNVDIDINAPKIGARIDNKDQNKNLCNYGCYFSFNNSALYSDFPQNCRNKMLKLKKMQNELTFMMDMNKHLLEIITDEDIKIEYNIPLDKPVSPSILLYDINDSIEIINQ